MMVEHPQQQSHHSTVPIQSEHQQIIEQHQFIVPTTTTTLTSHDPHFYDEEVDGENGCIINHIVNDKTTIKQVRT